MAKLVSKIVIPVTLSGIFAIAIFIAISYERLGLSFYIIVLFLVVYVFLSGLVIGQNLSDPIKKILDKATELSKGNLSSRVYLETKDELSELAKVFNKIAEELEESHLREENTEKSIGIKVKARTEELEETINALDQKVKNKSIELERLVGELDKLKEAGKSK